MNGFTYVLEKISDYIELKSLTNLQDALLIQNMSIEKQIEMGFDTGHSKLNLHQLSYAIKQQGPHLHLIETSAGFFASFKDESGRYFYDVWESNDLLNQLPPLLVCILMNKGRSAIPSNTKLNITKCHTEKNPDKVENITVMILEKLKTLKNSIPKLNLKIHPADADRWMNDPSSDPSESIEKEIAQAVEIHDKKNTNKPFMISAITFIEEPKNQCLKETAVLLSLRKMLIRRGRKRNQENLT